MRRILVAYDGSASAHKAFALGMELAAKYQAEVDVLAIARPPEFGTEVETEAVIEKSRQHCHHLLKQLQVGAATGSVVPRFHVAVGHPAEQIVRHAENWKSDLIVMGHRGHSLFERWLAGSVAKRVIDLAQCDVLIAR